MQLRWQATAVMWAGVALVVVQALRGGQLANIGSLVWNG